MEYYKRKSNALRMIKRMAFKEIEVATIKLEILERFALSGLLVDKYLESLQEAGFLRVKENGSIKCLSLIKKIEDE